MKFHCPTCGQKLEIGDEFAGQTTGCPSRRAEVVIPEGEPAVTEQEIDPL